MKYKSVPVENMTIWQLGQAVSEGGEFYDEFGDRLYIEEDIGAIGSDEYEQMGIVIQLKEGKITTHEPIEWYEELPKLVKVGVVVGVAFDSPSYRSVSFNGLPVPYEDCTPLTTEEAAKFGV